MHYFLLQLLPLWVGRIYCRRFTWFFFFRKTIYYKEWCAMPALYSLIWLLKIIFPVYGIWMGCSLFIEMNIQKQKTTNIVMLINWNGFDYHHWVVYSSGTCNFNIFNEEFSHRSALYPRYVYYTQCTYMLN